MGGRAVRALLGDVGDLADGRLPHNEGSNDAQTIAPGRMTPDAATVTELPLREERGSLIETAPWATREESGWALLRALRGALKGRACLAHGE
jgi:hypothetical protein